MGHFRDKTFQSITCTDTRIAKKWNTNTKYCNKIRMFLLNSTKHALKKPTLRQRRDSAWFSCLTWQLVRKRSKFYSFNLEPKLAPAVKPAYSGSRKKCHNKQNCCKFFSHIHWMVNSQFCVTLMTRLLLALKCKANYKDRKQYCCSFTLVTLGFCYLIRPFRTDLFLLWCIITGCGGCRRVRRWIMKQELTETLDRQHIQWTVVWLD